MRSNVYRLLVPREQAPGAQYPLTIAYNSKLSVRLPKKRFAHKKCQKNALQCGCNNPNTPNGFLKGFAKPAFLRGMKSRFFGSRRWLASAKHQVDADLGRLEACLRTDTKMEPQGRKCTKRTLPALFWLRIIINKVSSTRHTSRRSWFG